MLPVGTPPPSASSSAERFARTNAGPGCDVTPEAEEVEAPAARDRPRGSGVAGCVAETREASRARAVVGLGHTFFATDFTTRSAVGRETSRRSTRSREETVRTSSAVRKFWPSSRERTSTSNPATRASERCFAAMASERARARGKRRAQM